ncbi:atlastin-1-like [Gigantopelta aegis]|uniref:atlastin-1-like n=1 Tax=Gigantopelta aegis TaxID=1735272 RepID=UPI001B88CA39|nr:atlastin-1-like [Gigantopelta aegis]
MEAIYQSKRLYVQEMKKLVGGDNPYMPPDQLAEEHNRCLKDAEQLFNETEMVGGQEFRRNYLNQLHREIDQEYDNFKKLNEIKNTTSIHATRTPAVLFTVMVAAYLVAKILGWCGFTLLANVLYVIAFIFTVLLLIWVLVPYTGGHKTVSAVIDLLADLIWDYMLCYIYTRAS